MGPFFTSGDEFSYVIALIIGIGFGFVLESGGFSTSKKLAGVFYGYDFTVIRVFFTAAITAAIGLFYFDYLGWVDFSALYINKFFIGSSIVGGLIMGLGFVIGGYCPGTSACAVGIGKIDAMIYLAGVIIGAMIFDLFYPLYGSFYKSGNMGASSIYELLGMSKELFLLIFVVFAAVTFYFTTGLQHKITKKMNKKNEQ